MRICWLWPILLLPTLGCREHVLLDGTFELTPHRILRDDCALASQGPELGSATLRTQGDLVSLTLSRPELRLVGTYRDGLEEMTFDGSLSNVSALLRGRECLLDTVTFHLDGAATSPSSFKGSMAINYEARQPDECTCQFWFQFEAHRR